MRTLIIAALAATSLLPTAAMAQSRYDQARPNQVRVVTVDRHGPYQKTTVWRGPAQQHRIVQGMKLEPGFYSRDHAIARPARYNLSRAGANHRWVRISDDAVLVNLRTGRVVTVVNRVFR